MLQAETLLVPKRESEAATRALDAARGAVQAARDAQTTLVLVAAAARQAQPDVQAAARSTRRSSSAARSRTSGGRRALGADARRGGGRADRAGGGAAARASAPASDVKRLRGDVDRLLLYALGQKQITVDDVREMAGPAALQDDWAMTNAIEAGHGGDALRQLALMLDAGAPPEKDPRSARLAGADEISGARAGDALRPAVEALFRTDLDLKRSAGDPRVLLERLVVELCAGKRADGR